MLGQEAQFGSIYEEAGEAAKIVPRLLMAARKAAVTVVAGEHSLGRAGAGQNFWQFREYAAHDRPQDIDWRQSARAERVYVRERERQSVESFLLWVDGYKGMAWSSHPNLPSKRLYGEVLLLAFAMVAVRCGETFRLQEEGAVTGRTEKALETLAFSLVRQHVRCVSEKGHEIGQKKEPHLHFKKSLEKEPHKKVQLEQDGPYYGEGLAAAAHGQTNKDKDNAQSSLVSLLHYPWPLKSVPVLIGDFWTQTDLFKEVISRLAQRTGKGVVIQVYDEAERTLPYKGRINFSGLTSPGLFKGQAHDISAVPGGMHFSHAPGNILVENVQSVREEYTRRVTAHCEALRQIVESRGWLFYSASTSSTPAPLLQAVWLAVSHGKTWRRQA